MEGSVVKFKTNFISREVIDDERLAGLKKWCEIFRERGLTPMKNGFSCGNLSFRTQDDKNEFVITASGISAQAPLTNESFVRVLDVDLEKMEAKAQGTKEPSSESMLHFAIYQKYPEIRAVFHGHCPEILRVAVEAGLKETQKEASYGSRELIQSVLEILGQEKFIVIKNHGFLALGQSMDEAGELALDIYRECCKIGGQFSPLKVRGD